MKFVEILSPLLQKTKIELLLFNLAFRPGRLSGHCHKRSNMLKPAGSENESVNSAKLTSADRLKVSRATINLDVANAYTTTVVSCLKMTKR